MSFDMNTVKETMENLEKNNMKSYFCETSKQAVELVESLLSRGETITCGGSMSLKESGVFALMQSGKYNFINRETCEDVEAVYRAAFTCDTYLMSTNALTRDGVLYNVDGNSNRVAALLYGPKSVIVVCGVNKICENIDEAIMRVKTVSAPLNTKRLHTGAYCESMERCKSLNADNPFMCDGCSGSGRICCNYVVSAKQRHKDRIKVVIVGENLGY
ncbi:MAG: lactate utilization protein [Eubacteriales bacterium]|nr:lactate utilization protein [Eubacteriales bacterium]